jgi:hypothetical protein
VPATFTVDNPIDIPVPGLTNLRQAIDAANKAAGLDTIQFAAALHFLGNGTAVIPVSGTLPTITDDLVIDGRSGVAGQRVHVLPAMQSAVIDEETGQPTNPQPQFRLFEIAPAAAFGGVIVTFKALTISGGNASNPADPNGGAIKSLNADLTLDNCFVQGNQAVGNGGGVWASGDPGMLTITRGSVVANNTAAFNGGGIEVYNTNLLINEGTQVTSNTAGLGGGGIAAFANGFGGIVGVKFVSLDGTNGLVSVSGNKAMNGDGGGVLVQELNVGAAVPDVSFKHTNVTGNTAIGIAPPAGVDWASGRGGGVAMVGSLWVDADNATSVTGNWQSAPAPTTAPFKLGVYLDPVLFVDTFSPNANVDDNNQL